MEVKFIYLMESLPTEYLSHIASELAFVSAVLGGFAATFLAQLIDSQIKDKKASWCIGSLACSAVLFVVSTIYFTIVVINTYPGAGDYFIIPLAAKALVAEITFIVGVYALLIAIGISGWIRSRLLGWVTGLIAALGIIAVSLNYIIG